MKDSFFWSKSSHSVFSRKNVGAIDKKQEYDIIRVVGTRKNTYGMGNSGIPAPTITSMHPTTPSATEAITTIPKPGCIIYKADIIIPPLVDSSMRTIMKCSRLKPVVYCIIISLLIAGTILSI